MKKIFIYCLLSFCFIHLSSAIADNNKQQSTLPAHSVEKLTSQRTEQKAQLWIDVRSKLEYKITHIEGDIHIPYKDIVNQVDATHTDKSTPIQLYCLSGVRSEKAKAMLEAAGYTNVSNAGGIAQVREKRARQKERIQKERLFQ